MKESPPQYQLLMAGASSGDLLNSATNSLAGLLNEHLPQIHHFKGRWSLIRTKLLSLQSLLSDSDSSLHCLSSNSLCSVVLSSLSASLSSASSLAARCSSITLPDGKLRTQSNIDSLSTTLDNHLRDLDILLRSDIVDPPNDVASPSPFPSPHPREAIWAEARNLITRLQIGTYESKNFAMDSLLSFIQEDDKNVLIAVAQGVVPVLVRSLDFISAEMRDKAVAAIARVSSVESSNDVLIAEGLFLLNHLIRVIELGSIFAKERACVALQALSSSRGNARAVVSRGGISSLLEICLAGTPSSQSVAAGVLRNLAKFEEIKENFIEEKAVPVLVGLSSSGTQSARENAVGCLSNLVCNNEQLKVMVAREGGVESLRNYWDSTPVGRGLEQAVELLINLGSYHPIGEVLISQGFTFRMLPLLDCGVLGVRMAAAKAVYELGFCSRARRKMGESGCISALVRMLDGKMPEEREVAAMALSMMLFCTFNRKMFKEEKRGILATVQVLDPLTKNLDKKWPIAVLMSLVQSRKCRKQMVSAGACVYLQKLVEMDVEGAKKLLESLGKGKVWGIFTLP